MTKEKLPKVANSHIQSAESERALEQVMSEPLFVLRKEQHRDYGVDYRAEVITDEREATNWHVPVQLRSQARAHLIEGGAAISVGFKPSALIYLFRAVGRSIVVAYDAERKLLFWEWTDRIVSALDGVGRTWREQHSVTVRVPTQNILDAATADFIRREVLADHQRAAEAQDNLLASGAASSTEPALHALGKDVLGAIRTSGLLLVSDGRHQEVLAALREVPETAWEQDTRIVLTAAFAYDRSGSPLQALYYANLLPEIAPADWSDDDKALLAHIRSNARLSLGQMDLATHWVGLRAMADKYPRSFVAAQAQLAVMARDVVYATGDDAVATVLLVLKLARELADERLARADDNPRARWALEVLLARVEMEVADRLMIAGAAEVGFAEALRVPIPLEQRVMMARAVLDVELAGGQRLLAIEKEAEQSGVPEWSAIARLTFLEAQVKRFGVAKTTHAYTHPGLASEGDNLLEETISSARTLGAQFAKLDCGFLAFRAKRLEGNSLVMLGRTDAALEVHRELITFARQIGLKDDAATLSDPPPQPPDERTLALRWANGDAEMFSFVEEQIMRRLGLPEDRRPILRQESLATQKALREKLTWCRHLTVKQGRSHTRSRETYYAKLPPRKAHCELFNYQSTFEHTDVDAIISAFKAAYCNGCQRREPFES